MTYQITEYTFNKAKQIGVIVLPSKNPKKKIDVFDRNGKKLASIGAISYYDYPNYLEKYGKHYADERRRLYKLRHSKNRLIVGSNGWFADQLLW